MNKELQDAVDWIDEQIRKNPELNQSEVRHLETIAIHLTQPEPSNAQDGQTVMMLEALNSPFEYIPNQGTYIFTDLQVDILKRGLQALTQPPTTAQETGGDE